MYIVYKIYKNDISRLIHIHPHTMANVKTLLITINKSYLIEVSL